MSNEFNIKHGFISKDNSIVNGSLTATTFYGDGSNLIGIYWSGSTGTNSLTPINSGSVASGEKSMAIGNQTTASGDNSHAGGDNSESSGLNSFVHSTNSLVTGDRSVVLGGQNLTGTTNDTVYVPNLNINNVGSGTSINNLGIDSNGNVVVGTSGSTGTVGGTGLVGKLALWSNSTNITYDDGITWGTISSNPTLGVLGSSGTLPSFSVGNGTISQAVNGYSQLTLGSFTSSNQYPIIGLTRSFGTRASNLDVPSGNILGALRWQSQTAGPSVVIQSFTTENHTSGSSGGKLQIQTTPNGSTTPSTRMEIGNDGVVSVGDTLTNGYQLRVKSTGDNYGGVYSYVNNGNPAGGAIGVLGSVSIISATGTSGNSGIVGQGYNSSVRNIGVRGTGSGQSGSPSSNGSFGGYFTGGNGVDAYGVAGFAGGNNISTNCYGGYFVANGTKVGGTNHTLWLEDGTEGNGKFLKSVTSDGKANWAQITKDDITDGISATGGTNGYVARWTPDGTTLGNSLIQDNGTSLSIGNAPNNISILDIDTTLQGPFITITKINTAGNQSAYGMTASSSGINSLGDNIGVAGFANGNSNRAIGVVGNAVNSVGNVNIGGYFTAANGVSNYSVQLSDGSQTSGGGKFLKDTGDGKANWVFITEADISGLTNDWSSQTGALVDTNTTISHTTLNTNTNSIIGGGQNNKLDNSDNAVIIGGINNNILSGNTSFIIGGSNNDIQARSGSDLGQSGVLGGSNNNIIDVSSDSDRSFIIGGVNNDINNSGDSIILSSGLSDITSSSSSSIVGSSSSLVTNSSFSSIIGGFNNELIGTTRSVVLGGQNITGTTNDTVYVPNLNIQNVPTGTTVTSLGVDTNGNVIKSNSPSSVAFSPINVGICDTAPTAASTQYYYQTIAEATMTISKAKLWGFSGSDTVLFGIYRGTLPSSVTLIGQGSVTAGIGPNEITLTAEVGQTLDVTSGEDLVVGFYADGTSWRTVYDSGISDTAFGITNAANIGSMPASPTGTATAIRFALTLY